MQLYNIGSAVYRDEIAHHTCDTKGHDHDHDHDEDNTKESRFNTSIEGDKERFAPVKEILVIGNDDKASKALLENTKEVAEFLGVKNEVVFKAADESMNKDDLPMLLINQNIVSKGTLLKGQDIENHLRKFAL